MTKGNSSCVYCHTLILNFILVLFTFLILFIVSVNVIYYISGKSRHSYWLTYHHIRWNRNLRMYPHKSADNSIRYDKLIQKKLKPYRYDHVVFNYEEVDKLESMDDSMIDILFFNHSNVIRPQIKVQEMNHVLISSLDEERGRELCSICIECFDVGVGGVRDRGVEEQGIEDQGIEDQGVKSGGCIYDGMKPEVAHLKVGSEAVEVTETIDYNIDLEMRGNENREGIGKGKGKTKGNKDDINVKNGQMSKIIQKLKDILLFTKRKEREKLNKSVSILPCSHIFHTKCLKEWLHICAKWKGIWTVCCPLCRLNLYKCKQLSRRLGFKLSEVTVIKDEDSM